MTAMNTGINCMAHYLAFPQTEAKPFNLIYTWSSVLHAALQLTVGNQLSDLGNKHADLAVVLLQHTSVNNSISSRSMIYCC